MKQRAIKSVRVSSFPLTDEQRKLHQKIHDEAPTDSDIRGESRNVVQELESRQRRFSEVTTALKEAREAAGMSLTDVSEATGISKSSLSLLENGKGNPTMETLERVAAAIGAEIKVTVTM